MKKTLKRAAVAVAAAGTVGAGTLVATPQAQAAVPNLHLSGYVTCKFGLQPGQPWTSGIWNMTREMKVTAYDGNFKNVTLQEINGQKRFAKELKKGQSLEIKTVWPGCFPSSISGYTISDYQENLLDNAGFWWNLRKIDKGNDNKGGQGGGTDNATAAQIRSGLK